MWQSYRAVLGRRDVLAAVLPYLLARLPLSMASLAILLGVRAQLHSFRSAGAVVGAYSVAVAVGAPVLGRLVDRRGQGRPLLACSLAHALAMLALAGAVELRNFPLALVAAAFAGAVLPPVSACMRVLWSRLLVDDGARQAGYAIDGVIVEAAELSGPLLVSLALVLGAPTHAIVVAGVMTGMAGLLFRLAPASRAVLPQDRTAATLGNLAPIRALLAVIATSTAAIGAVEVAVAGFARHHGGSAGAGVYVALISVGGITGGLVFGGARRLAAGRRLHVLVATLLVAAASAAVAAASPETPALVLPALLAFGAAIAVGVVVQLALMADLAEERGRTEAFTWAGTANFLGLGLGTMVGGFVADHAGVSATFLAASAPAVLAVCAAVPLRARSRRAWSADVERPDAEVARLRDRVADLEQALEAALLSAPEQVVADARARAQRMLERADAACLELRERADEDAERVRAAATTAALEIMASAQRDAQALLERARRHAERLRATMGPTGIVPDGAEADGADGASGAGLPRAAEARANLVALPRSLP